MRLLFNIAEDSPVVPRSDVQLFALTYTAAQVKCLLRVRCGQIGFTHVAVSRRQLRVGISKVRVELDGMLEEWNGRGALYCAHRSIAQAVGLQGFEGRSSCLLYGGIEFLDGGEGLTELFAKARSSFSKRVEDVFF